MKKNKQNDANLLADVFNSKGMSVAEIERQDERNHRMNEEEPFDPAYLLGVEEEVEDVLYSGEEAYCRKVWTLTNNLRKFGIRGSWSTDQEFLIERHHKLHKRFSNGETSDRVRKEAMDDLQTPFQQLLYVYVDYDDRHYIVETDDESFYEGHNISKVMSTINSWLKFKI